MDNLDMEILGILINDGRQTHENISKRLNLSRPAVRQRVKRLEEKGLIKGYQAIVDWSKVGQNIYVLIYLKINASILQDIVNKIMDIKTTDAFLEECHRLAGEWCLMLKVRSTSPQNITSYIDELLKIKGIVGTSTTFILSTMLK